MHTGYKREIINILKSHPEGLTTVDIAKITGLSRVTVAKYVYGLKSENMIEQRKIGPAKLCFLKKRSKEGRR